jgi:hypothetical protein
MAPVAISVAGAGAAKTPAKAAAISTTAKFFEGVFIRKNECIIFALSKA